MRDDKQKILDEIVDYIIGEDFPIEHLRALKRIVTLFNWSSESELEIFEFAKKIHERYSQIQ